MYKHKYCGLVAENKNIIIIIIVVLTSCFIVDGIVLLVSVQMIPLIEVSCVALLERLEQDAQSGKTIEMKM